MVDSGRRTETPRPVSTGRIVARRLGVLAVAGFIVWVVWWSPIFALRAEEVSVVSDGSLVDIDAVGGVVDVFVGKPLTRLDLGDVEEACGTVVGVLDVRAEREWPHGLTVEVTERTPVATIADSAQGYLLVDIEGVVLDILDQPQGDLPVVTVPVGEGNSRILSAALTAVAALPPELAIRIEAVRAETEDSVTLFVRDGPRIEWGSAEDSALKAQVIEVMLSVGGTPPEIIDVSAPTLVVTRDE